MAALNDAVRESDAALHPAILRLADTWPGGSLPFRLMLILHRIGYHARCPELARRIELMRGGLYPSEVAELHYQCCSGGGGGGGGGGGDGGGGGGDDGGGAIQPKGGPSQIFLTPIGDSRTMNTHE